MFSKELECENGGIPRKVRRRTGIVGGKGYELWERDTTDLEYQ